MTDTELITAARAGDSGAWEELYGRWLPWVWRYAYSLIGDRHLAEDVTSEAMIAWVRRLQESEAEAAQLAGWLRTVVRNKSADHIRRLTRLRKAVAGVAAISPASEEAAPSQPLEREERRRQVRETLITLPEQHQLVLEWKYAEGLSVRQIAERLGATEKSVEATLYRARREFRQRHETIQVPPSSGAIKQGKGAARASEGRASERGFKKPGTTDNADASDAEDKGARGSATTAPPTASLALVDNHQTPGDGPSQFSESDERSDVST